MDHVHIHICEGCSKPFKSCKCPQGPVMDPWDCPACAEEMIDQDDD